MKKICFQHLVLLLDQVQKIFLIIIKNLDKNKNNSENLSMIGQFGVGFYSAFMVAEKVEVLSKKAGEKNSFKWISDGSSGFQVEKDDKKLAGTDIILYLKKDAKEFLDETRISFLLRNTQII